jgi:hypothetical protein
VCALHLDRGVDRLAGAREGEEERVALRVDLASTGRAERLADDPAMLRENLAVRLPELLEERSRALDVGEDERDRARRQLRHLLNRSCRDTLATAHPHD